MSENQPPGTKAIEGSGSPARVPAVRLQKLTPTVDKPITVAADGSSIGSHPSNGVRLDEKTVSRFHCEVGQDERGLFVRDLKSTNGTIVDGVLVEKGYLKHGSRLVLGKVELAVEFSGDIESVPLSDKNQFGPLIGSSVPMRRVFTQLERAAGSDATVLINGETGTGKEAAAEAIHGASRRANGPFVVIDCGAIHPHLLESELFGHERGAFTGANESRAGAFEEANGGTIFLDELGELPLELQPRLLRVLEKREVRRVGQNDYRPVDVRVIAATHRDLRTLTNEGEFRPDLYYRLAVMSVRLPSLRERLDDLPMLADHLLGRLGLSPRQRADMINEEMLTHLRVAAWPGNVRELRNYLERCMVLGEVVPMADGLADGTAPSVRINPHASYHEARKDGISDWERQYLLAVLAQHKGVKLAAIARTIGIDRHYFYRLLRRHRLIADTAE